MRRVDLDAVRWTEGFWADRFALCRRAILPAVRGALDDPQNAAVLANFRVAAGLEQGKHRGANWSDGDCYKFLEAAAHVHALTHDAELNRLLDEWIEVIGKTQAGDGYISTNIQLTGRPRFANPHHHELYNMGHLLTAACVHHRATGKDSFLRIARKLGDFLHRTFAPRPPELAHFGWNPSNIMGLAELYRTTREGRYLELARTFVEMRGSAQGGSDLTQDHVPLRTETMAVGHCVCATYLYAGAADVIAETGDRELRGALERIWEDVTGRRMYITGAVGSAWKGKSPRGDDVHEAFGADYELPPRTAYNETCANIGHAMWNCRMLALSGEAKYADVMETVLYNSALSAVGLDGMGFFYCNPLAWDGAEGGPSKHHTAQRWGLHGCYCCPPQVARTLASLHAWAYGVSDDGLWVHLYGGSVLETDLPGGGAVRLRQTTDYPWDGRVRIVVERAPTRALTIRLRIPGWVEGASAAGPDDPAARPAEPGTYLAMRRQWSAGDTIQLNLPLPVRVMEAHPAARDLHHRVAVVRGPIVYCLESPDLPAGVALNEVCLPDGVELRPGYQKDLLGGVVVLTGTAVRGPARDGPMPPAGADWQGTLYRQRKAQPRPRARDENRSVAVRLIPYYAWANRGVSHMAVWLPLADAGR